MFNGMSSAYSDSYQRGEQEKLAIIDTGVVKMKADLEKEMTAKCDKMRAERDVKMRTLISVGAKRHTKKTASELCYRSSCKYG